MVSAPSLRGPWSTRGNFLSPPSPPSSSASNSVRGYVDTPEARLAPGGSVKLSIGVVYRVSC